MNRNNKQLELNYKDFVPVLSGLIGKVALVSSFAYVWAQELSISNPVFVLENVRIEILIGSIITLIAAILYPNAAPAGTLSPLVVLIPTMSAFGVHPLILGVTVGFIGFLVVKSGIFKHLVDLAGFICKTSITLTFGISGIWMSLNKLNNYFRNVKQIFVTLVIVLTLVYLLLLYYKKNWLVIPIVSIVSIMIPYLFQHGYDFARVKLNLNIDPSYWWHDQWGLGFGFNMVTFVKTIPFALFVILLWTIDTVSIQTIREASYKSEEAENMDVEQSFLIVAVRNIIGAFFGGAQTGSLWRSFLIPLYMVKRPMHICAVLLGITGIISSLTVVPIQIMLYPPLVWSVLLFGIFMPFTVTSIVNIYINKSKRTKIIILLLTILGVGISPVLPWILSVAYEKYDKLRKH